MIKMSGIGITEISGKFGGTVGARNKTGMIARNRVKGTNPKTNKQITQRAAFATQSASFRDLTAAERLAWQRAAESGEWPYRNRLGEAAQPSGSQLFNRLNDNIVSVGGTPITTPPLKVAMSQITLGALTSAAGTPALSLVFTGTIGADETLVVEGTFGTSPGVSNPSRFNKLTNYTSTSPANLLASYQAVFGNPIAGTKIFIRCYLVNDTTGQRIDVGQVSAVVAA